MKFLRYLFGYKLAFLLINLFAFIVSLSTIIILGNNLFNIKGSIDYVTLFLLVTNALFLGIKTTLNIFTLFVDYKVRTAKDKQLSKSVKIFKEILEKEDFRL